MTDSYQNPFFNDPDRQAIWTMLVERDIEAYLHADWSLVVDDFVEAHFMGIDARKMVNPDQWHIAFPTLAHYRAVWLAQANAALQHMQMADLRRAVVDATTLTQIDLVGDRALAHKKFDGGFMDNAGIYTRLYWQTLYQCKKIKSQWKITGFIGYLPHPTSASRQKTGPSL